jgi:hypothetical protein
MMFGFLLSSIIPNTPGGTFAWVEMSGNKPRSTPDRNLFPHDRNISKIPPLAGNLKNTPGIEPTRSAHISMEIPFHLPSLALAAGIAAISALFVSQAGCQPHGERINPVEVGKVKWERDYESALTSAKKSGKPVFLLFQEVPGCAGPERKPDFLMARR